MAQAWHWVEPERAVPEVARVLRPGGRLGLLWNLRDERVEWVAELGRILGSRSELAMERGARDLGELFEPVAEFEVARQEEMTPPKLLDLVVSRSYVITASAERRDGLIAQVRRLLDTHPALAGKARFELPYLTQCFRADKVRPMSGKVTG
jgi:SAM-dependent methyltransferase